MTPRTGSLRPGRRPARWPLTATLAGVLLAAPLTGCATFSGRVPRCGDPLRLAIVAQSVPGAAYVPCIRELPQGWTTSGFDPGRGGTTFLLNSDRAAGRPVTVPARGHLPDQPRQPLPTAGTRRAHLHPTHVDLPTLRRPPV